MAAIFGTPEQPRRKHPTPPRRKSTRISEFFDPGDDGSDKAACLSLTRRNGQVKALALRSRRRPPKKEAASSAYVIRILVSPGKNFSVRTFTTLAYPDSSSAAGADESPAPQRRERNTTP